MPKLFITGDTHAHIDIGKLASKNWKKGASLTRNDCLIIVGDFGLVWSEKSETEIYYRNWLNTKPWTTLFVDGNHENHEALRRFPIKEKFNGLVSEIMPNIFWLRRGEVYEINGKKIFTFGGAQSTDRIYRTEGISWWPREIPSDEEYQNGWKNLAKHDNEVDIVVSHTICHNEVANFIDGGNVFHGNRMFDPTCFMLQDFKDKIQFKDWYFGHYHTDKTIGKFHCLYQRIEEII